jgi:cholesterol oxidase
VTPRRHDAVVVGSGFGGAVTALRLAEAGRDVLVLERGRDYRDGRFPRDPTDVASVFWRKPGDAGLYDLRFLSGLGVVAASGVGGGSLIYANIHVRPDAGVFDDPRWPRAIKRATLDPYFDRVAATLQLSPPPGTLRIPKREAFHRAAESLGRPIFDPDMAVSWDACRLGADCEFGCPHGAKRSLDVTYLARAEACGATITTRVFATHIEPDTDGYRVHFVDAGGARNSVSARRVILSAGTLGTNELLLRSKLETRTLPRLSDALGRGISANGDFIASLQNAKVDLEPWVGPDVTSVMRFTDTATPFTLAAPTFNRTVTTVLASLGQPHVGWLRFAGPALWPRLGALLPLAFAHGALSRPQRFRARNAGDPSRMTNLFAIGRDNANGRASWRRGRLDISWSYAKENRALVAAITQAMREVAAVYGGTLAPLFTWGAFRRTITVHPLGGCAMSETPATGVVSPEGEVFGYPGLFVADGSVVPSSLGFHPAMTIAGIAERAAEAMVQTWRE